MREDTRVPSPPLVADRIVFGAIETPIHGAACRLILGLRHETPVPRRSQQDSQSERSDIFPINRGKIFPVYVVGSKRFTNTRQLRSISSTRHARGCPGRNSIVTSTLERSHHGRTFQRVPAYCIRSSLRPSEQAGAGLPIPQCIESFLEDRRPLPIGLSRFVADIELDGLASPES